MPALTIGSAVVPFASQWKENGVVTKTITGAGGDASELAAAVSGSRHVIVGGRLSCDGADEVTILSASTQIDILQFAARATASLPIGRETATGEALNLNKVGTSATVDGWIAYASLKDGDSFPPALQ